MSVFRAIDITTSALSAERLRLEVHLTNLANSNTTRTAEGGPFRRRQVLFQADGGSFGDALGGVIARVTLDPTAEPRLVFAPAHPDANQEGYVAMPDIDPVLEQADIVAAARGYEANLAVLRITKEILGRALEIGR